MKTTIAIVATAFGTMLSWATPTIVNDTVVPVQDPAIRRVTVPYTLVDDDAIVTLHVRKNGEEIGDEHLRRVWGDVNRRVSPGNRVLYWQPDETWQWQGETVEISVKAWAVDNPPEYMSWDILCPTNIMYYTSSNAVPGGVLDIVYRTNKMLFRHVPAAGVTWLMGSPSNESKRQSRENQHKVTLSKDYFIGVFPVTVCQYYHIKNNYGNPALSSVNEMDDAISSVSEFCRLAYYEGYGHGNVSPSYSRGVRLACPIDLLNW